MYDELQHASARAVLAGSTLDAIERDIVDPAAIDEEQKAPYGYTPQP